MSKNRLSSRSSHSLGRVLSRSPGQWESPESSLGLVPQNAHPQALRAASVDASSILSSHS